MPPSCPSNPQGIKHKHGKHKICGENSICVDKSALQEQYLLRAGRLRRFHAKSHAASLCAHLNRPEERPAAKVENRLQNESRAALHFRSKPLSFLSDFFTPGMPL